jgi:hypothetical protein
MSVGAADASAREGPNASTGIMRRIRKGMVGINRITQFCRLMLGASGNHVVLWSPAGLIGGSTLVTLAFTLSRPSISYQPSAPQPPPRLRNKKADHANYTRLTLFVSSADLHPPGLPTESYPAAISARLLHRSVRASPSSLSPPSQPRHSWVHSSRLLSTLPSSQFSTHSKYARRRAVYPSPLLAVGSLVLRERLLHSR